MRRIRILHVNKLYHPWTGGIESAVQHLVEGCLKFPEFETEVLVCQPKGEEAHEFINGVPVHRAASLGMAFSMPVSTSFPSRLRHAKNKFDIIHVHFPFPLALAGGWDHNPRSACLVVHYHSDVVRPLQKIVLSAIKHLRERMLQAASVILVGSEAMMHASNVLQPYKEKCRVLPYPVGAEKLLPDATTESSQFGSTSCRPRVLFVGRLVRYKGVEYLIRAMNHVDGDLVIAGDGPLRNSLESLTRRLCLGDRVSFTGAVTDQELGRLYRTASIFVLPSITPAEAFGLVQVEAMLHGVPVINTSLPTGVPSVSVDSESGFTVPPRDPAALAAAMNRILTDSRLRASFSANAIQRATRYSPTCVLRQLRTIYHGLVGTL